MRALAFALVVLPVVAHAAFKKGPYPQAVTRDGAVLIWQSNTNAPATVKVSGPDGFEKTWSGPRPDAEGMAQVKLDGLKAGTSYRYEVDLGGARAEGRLLTQPRPGQPFSFVVFGDNRSDHRAHAAVIEGIIATEPDFLVSTGDLVGHGGDESDWIKFFEIEQPLLANAPLYPVLGNHEIYGGGETLFERYFVLPGNERYYAFTWGNLRFIAIDGEIHTEFGGNGPNPEQKAWLLKEIQASAADPKYDHIIGFVHRGPWSSHVYRTGNEGLRRIMPELQAAGLTLLLSGHDHFFERGISKGGLPYMVIGGGGAPLYETIGPGDHGEYIALTSRSVHSFVRMRSSGGLLSGCAVDLTGASFDCFEYPPRKKPAAPGPAMKSD